MYLNTVFKYNVFKYCPALMVDLFIVDRQWRMAGKPTQPAKDILT